jgi:5'-methylthioadenosine phosphorylase
VLNRNVTMAKEIVRRLAPLRPMPRKCPCSKALEAAIITDRARIPASAKRRLGLLVGKYLD